MLTDAELIAAIDDLTAVRAASPDAVRERTGQADLDVAYAFLFVDAQHLLRQCADRIRQLGS